MTDKQLLTLFPTTESNWPNENVRTEGALLRDYFAAKAMQGILANSAMIDSAVCDSSAQWVSDGAYRMADAMLKARG